MNLKQNQQSGDGPARRNLIGFGKWLVVLTGFGFADLYGAGSSGVNPGRYKQFLSGSTDQSLPFSGGDNFGQAAELIPSTVNCA